jgi:hypothetical protein
MPVSALARACASMVEPRMKFTTGSPKPRFAKLLPVIVKLAGGLARSTVLGSMAPSFRPAATFEPARQEPTIS